MNSKILAQKVFKIMFDNDQYSNWMGIQCIEIDKGYCKLQMVIRAEMLNGFSIAHGGICYALADSALAFASNSHGRKCVSIETNISHIEAVKENEILTATTEEVAVGNKTAIYHININNQQNKLVALFKGTVYRTSKNWFDEE